MYYNGQIAVDTAHHVITHAATFTPMEKTAVI
jgi:hypothetical protein